MSREIKFRSWDKKRSEMKQVQLMDWSDWWVSTGHTWQREIPLKYGERNSFKNESTDRHVLMQYTGLKDKNGIEIYEGDIVVASSMGQTAKCEVKWSSPTARFFLSNAQLGIVWNLSGGGENCVEETVEIIGNIYENPELLGGEMK